MLLWQTHVKNNVLFYLFVENTCRGPYSLIKDLNDKGNDVTLCLGSGGYRCGGSG